MKNTPLKPGKPLARKTPMSRGKGIKRGTTKMRRKAKPTTRRAKMEAETEKRCMAAYRGLPCIICLFQAVVNRDRTCGHHIVPKGRCRCGRHDAANIAPVCQSHHRNGNDICPHAPNPLASARFDRHLEDHMPKRFAATRLLDERARQGPPYTIDEVEWDHAFWADMEGHNYEYICAAAGVEAYAVQAEKGDSDG